MNPVALVTGGGVRVGRAIALGLVESGYDLVVSYNSSGTGAAEVATAASRLGRRVHPVQAETCHAKKMSFAWRARSQIASGDSICWSIRRPASSQTTCSR